MKKFLLWLLLVVLAVGTGVGSTLWILERHAEANWAANGQWIVNLNAGSQADGMYSKATIAMGGLLAMNPREALYFVTSYDSGGDRLNAGCTYRVDGVDPDARWWSLTAYGADYMLIDNPGHIYSADFNSVSRKADGTWSVLVSPREAGPNLVPTGGGEQRIYLLMRLYNPGKSLRDDPTAAVMPAVTKVSCP